MPDVWVPHPSETKVAPYLRALRQVGLNAIHIVPDSPLPAIGPDALLLAGGTDVDAALYGQTRGVHTEAPEVERDRLEMQLLTDCLARDLPILAICRGLQILNVCLGGTLVQHIESGSHVVRVEDAGKPVHQVAIETGTLLHRIYGRQTIEVNSRHHQAAGEIGGSLLASGLSKPDNIIEALEHPGKRFVVGVQWHPEDQWESDPLQLQLFTAFADAVTG